MKCAALQIRTNVELWFSFGMLASLQPEYVLEINVPTVNIPVFVYKYRHNNMSRGSIKIRDGVMMVWQVLVSVWMNRKEGHSVHAMRWHIEMLSLCQSETPVSLPFLPINHFYLYNKPTLLSSQSFGQDRQTDRSITRIISHYFVHTLFQRSHYRSLWVFWVVTDNVQ